MEIRPVTLEDIPALVQVDKRAFGDFWNEKMFSEEIQKDYSFYFSLTENGEIIGYGGIWCIYETAELIRIAVTPDRQGCGGGKAIMEKLFSCAEDKGCERMLLEVRKSNEKAQGLYGKFGFGEINVRRGYYNGEDAVIMEAML